MISQTPVPIKTAATVSGSHRRKAIARAIAAARPSATPACASPSFTSSAAGSPLRPGRSSSSRGSGAELGGPV